MRPGPHFAFRIDPVNVSFHIAPGQDCFSVLLVDKGESRHQGCPIQRILQQTEVQTVLCGHELSLTQSLLVHGQRTLLFCSIKLPRVIIAEMTLLNNPEVYPSLLSFLSSEVGNLSTKTCFASLSVASSCRQGLGRGSRSSGLFVPLGLEEHRFYLCFILFFFIFHLKAIQQFVS